MGILKLLIPTLFISFFLGELPKVKLLGSAAIGPLDLVAVCFFIYWSLKVKKSKKYKLEKPILIFSITALFSLVINIFNYLPGQLLVAFLYLFRWVLYSSMYFVVKDIAGEEEKNFFKFSTLLIGLLIIASLLQFIFFPNLISLYHFGWDKHLNRIFSTFLDPNFAGVIFVLFFFYLFTFRERVFKNNKQLSFVFIILSFISIILTYSRGAILMFLVSALVYTLISKNKKIFLGACVSIAVVFIILIPGFYLENTNLLRTNSVLERIATSKQALIIFKDHPFGIGFDAYRYAREKYGDLDYQLAGPSHAGAGLDNSLFFVLVTAGFIGLISYLYLLFEMIKMGYNKRKNIYGLILVVSLSGLIVNSLTINSLFYSFIMFWIWIIAGLTESS